MKYKEYVTDYTMYVVKYHLKNYADACKISPIHLPTKDIMRITRQMYDETPFEKVDIDYAVKKYFDGLKDTNKSTKKLKKE